MAFFPLIVVIHETYVNTETILSLHEDPQFIASYHAVIDPNGVIHYLVPADAKAYGAAESVFRDSFGEEQQINGSVDDFAYHISLVTPDDGRDRNKKAHSGYTRQQYKSLAWLCHSTGVARNRIVTHAEIKLEEAAITEPRCFNDDYFSHTNPISSINKNLMCLHLCIYPNQSF